MCIDEPSSRSGFSRDFHRRGAVSSDRPHSVSISNYGGLVCCNIRILVLVATYLGLDETDPIRMTLVLPSGKMETSAAEAFSCHS